MSYDAEKYKELCESFDKVCKRVENYRTRKLTTNPDKVKEYKDGLVQTYNDLLMLLIPHLTSVEDKIEIQNRIVTHHKRLKECFQILLFEYSFEQNIYALIDLDRITETRNLSPISKQSLILPKSPNPNRDSLTDSDSSASSTSTVIDNTNNNPTKSASTELKGGEQQQRSPSRTDVLLSENSDSESDPDMAQSAKNLMQLATSTINYKFEGDPMKLDSFIDAIELLEEHCEPQNKDILLKFLMTKLEGKAREAIVTKPKKIEEIKTQLRDAIKTESSKVIEGRISALRADKMNMTRFAERAEELVENYRRSLISEGFTKEKAKQFAVERTVDLCRNSAINLTYNAEKYAQVVVSILGAATFSEPKDVIARMITEINKLKDLHITINRKNNNHNNQRNGKGQQQNKSHKNNSGNFHSYSGSNNNSHGNGNGNNRQNNGNGRQNYQNQGNRSVHNSSNSRTITNSNYRRSNDSQQVRYIQGNETAPGNGGQNTNTNQ